MPKSRRNQTRLVVGLVSTAGELIYVLGKLRELTSGPVTAIAQPAPVEALRAHWRTFEGAAASVTWLVGRRSADGGPWIIDAACSNASQPGSLYSARALLSADHWALRRQIQRLKEHLDAGRALLILEPGSDAEERAVATVLLRHTSGGVQTHDVSPQPDVGSQQERCGAGQDFSEP